MNNLKCFVLFHLRVTNTRFWSFSFFFTFTKAEVNEETGQLEEQGGEKQGDEVKAGLCV